MIIRGTLYQVGFEMIDHIAQAQGVLMNTIQSKALIGIGSHSVDFFFLLFLLISFLFLLLLDFFLPL